MEFSIFVYKMLSNIFYFDDAFIYPMNDKSKLSKFTILTLYVHIKFYISHVYLTIVYVSDSPFSEFSQYSFPFFN